jgi:hypothetical protein
MIIRARAFGVVVLKFLVSDQSKPRDRGNEKDAVRRESAELEQRRGSPPSTHADFRACLDSVDFPRTVERRLP